MEWTSLTYRRRNGHWVRIFEQKISLVNLRRIEFLDHNGLSCNIRRQLGGTDFASISLANAGGCWYHFRSRHAISFKLERINENRSDQTISPHTPTQVICGRAVPPSLIHLLFSSPQHVCSSIWSCASSQTSSFIGQKPPAIERRQTCRRAGGG